jgi:hypothetical protein
MLRFHGSLRGLVQLVRLMGLSLLCAELVPREVVSDGEVWGNGWLWAVVVWLCMSELRSDVKW